MDELDLFEIEELFSVAEVVAKTTTVVDTKSKRIANIVDPKKSQNLGIILATIKISFEEIKSAVVRVDDDILNQMLLKQLADYAPSQEDVNFLQIYQVH